MFNAKLSFFGFGKAIIFKGYLLIGWTLVTNERERGIYIPSKSGDFAERGDIPEYSILSQSHSFYSSINIKPSLRKVSRL